MHWWMGAWLTLRSLLLLMAITLASVLIWYVRRRRGEATEDDQSSAVSRPLLGRALPRDPEGRDGEGTRP